MVGKRQRDDYHQNLANKQVPPAPKLLPAPVMPSPEEVSKHNLTHYPFADWCPFCVAGKANDQPHSKVEVNHEDHKTVVMFDFGYVTDGDELDWREAGELKHNEKRLTGRQRIRKKSSHNLFNR